MPEHIRKRYHSRTSALSYQHSLLSRIYLPQRGSRLIQRFVSKGVLFSKKKIKRYKNLALSALVTKRIIRQHLLYVFSFRLVEWMRRKIDLLYKKDCTYFKRKRGNTRKSSFKKTLGYKRKIHSFLRMFNIISYKRTNIILKNFINNLPETFLPRLRKRLIISRIRQAMRPISTYVTWKNRHQPSFFEGFIKKKKYRNSKQRTFSKLAMHALGPLYLQYNRPPQQWLARFFQRTRHRYKIFSLSLFSAYKGYSPFTQRKRRKRRTATRKGHYSLEKHPKKYKNFFLRDNVAPAAIIKAEVYLKYFYDYSLSDLYKITNKFYKIFPGCSIGLIFFYINKRLDFLVRRKFCFYRMSVIREVLKKGLVCVNGVVIKDPSFIVHTGQLISFGMSIKNYHTSYLLGLFYFMFSIRSFLLRRTFKKAIYKILIEHLKQRSKSLLNLIVPSFNLRKRINYPFLKRKRRKREYKTQMRSKRGMKYYQKV